MLSVIKILLSLVLGLVKMTTGRVVWETGSLREAALFVNENY